MVLINFNLSEDALTEQVLARTVKLAQPALSRQHAGIRTRLASLRAKLQSHEDSLLRRLTDAPGDILSDGPLVQQLSITREAAACISSEVVATEATESKLQEAFGRFRDVAAFMASLFSIINRLSSLSPMYQMSLSASVFVLSVLFAVLCSLTVVVL